MDRYLKGRIVDEFMRERMGRHIRMYVCVDICVSEHVNGWPCVSGYVDGWVCVELH